LFARRALLRWSATNSNNAKSGTCVFDNPASGLNVEDEKGVRMRRLVHIGLRALIIVPILSCSSMTVRADHDSQNDFSGYASFAIFARQGNEKKQPQMSPIVDRRIGDAMAAELRAKGFDTSSPHNADFLVTFYTAVRRRVVVHHGGWYGWRGWGWRGGTRWVNSYPEGTLVIDIIDRRDRQLVWRGVGEGAFSTTNPSDEKVAKRVAKILSSFPPQG
jgi:hypothetical protein